MSTAPVTETAALPRWDEQVAALDGVRDELIALLGFEPVFGYAGLWGRCPVCSSDACCAIGLYDISCEICKTVIEVGDALSIYGPNLCDADTPFLGRDGRLIHDPVEARLDYIAQVKEDGFSYIPEPDAEAWRAADEAHRATDSWKRFAGVLGHEEGGYLRLVGSSDDEEDARAEDGPQELGGDRDENEAVEAEGTTAEDPEEEPAPEAYSGPVTLVDFESYMPDHKYIFSPTRELWPAVSVDARIPKVLVPGGERDVKASTWLDRHRPVEQMIWSPGEPMIITDRLVDHGGWIDRPGVRCFNLYRGPSLELRDPSAAGRWIELVQRLYPEEASHIVAWLAHRRRRPHEKINHALVLGGLQGIGKDSILEPVKYAIGPWNFSEVSPTHLLGRFNGFVKSVILRVSEARDLGDVDRFSFYDHSKAYMAAPPDVIRCDEKFLREFSVFNVCGVIITTNHQDGIFLPPDDRRHFVAWSELTKDDFTPDYWTGLYGWYEREGYGHVAAYLDSLDLSDFNPKAPPPKTAAFWACVDAHRAPEDAELADVLDRLMHPAAVTLADLARCADAGLSDWLLDRRNATKVPHRLRAAGYEAVPNQDAKSGLWVVGGKRQRVYARKDLPVRDRIIAAQGLVEGYRQ